MQTGLVKKNRKNEVMEWGQAKKKRNSRRKDGRTD